MSRAKVVTKTVDGANQFTDPISATYKSSGSGFINLSAVFSSGADLIITVQRRFTSIGTWRDVTQYIADYEGQVFEAEESVQYRAGCKVGDHTSGEAELRLSR